MLSFVSFLSIWSVVGGIYSLQAAPAVGPEIFEQLSAVPGGWRQVNTPSPSTQIQLRIALRQQKVQQFEQTVLDVSTPGHPRYGQHLTSGEVKTLLRPTDTTISSVLGWLYDEGVPNSSIKSDGDWITFNVTVEHANRILNTDFFTYRNSVNKVEKIRTLRYSVPKNLHQAIVMIQPTTRFGQIRPLRSSPFVKDLFGDADGIAKSDLPSSSLNFTSCNTTITPSCLRKLYNVGDFEADPNNGNKLGICGYLDQYAKFDALKVFLSEYAPYAAGSNFTVISINGGRNDQNSTLDDAEANLDVQYGIALSYPVPSTYYTTGGLGLLVPDLDQPTPADNLNEPYLDFLHYILALEDHELPQTLTTSYGEDEQSIPNSYTQTVCTMFGQLGARGVSVIFSSGDTGVGSACQTNDGKNTTRFLPIFPASCPWVTSVGGTFGVQPERAIFFSSGGFSDRFPRPQYQNAAVQDYLKVLGDQWEGLYNPDGRGFPDVAAQSSRFHFIDKGKEGLIGGTSASAPTFAALISLLNSARLSANLPPMGFLNPWIYSIGKLGLNDITVGGSTGCTGEDQFSGLATPIVPFASWNATVGWDPVTGLGTPDFGKLLELSRAFGEGGYGYGV
ncbi:MAG: vesicle formation at the endoplasmic reticulum [Trichoglossum hirsutum]|nr:MAG: vesicle formation at the endoplasmic reticulum [Trichoglossum hirsutum]